MLDEYKIQALWEEIRESEHIAEKQLQELQELIKALEALQSKYNTIDKNLTEDAKLLTTILQKANVIYENIEHFETQTNKNLQYLQEELKSTIKSITTQLQDDLDSILNALKGKIQTRERELQELVNDYSVFADKAHIFWKDAKEYTQEELNNLKEQIETQTQEIFTELEQKSLLQRWGAVAGAFAIGVAVSFIFLIPTIKAKMHVDKIVQVVKIKDPQAQEIIAKLQNKNKKLKGEIDYLKEYKIPDDWRFSCDTKKNPHKCIGVPAKFVDRDTYEGKDYYFIHLPN